VVPVEALKKLDAANVAQSLFREARLNEPKPPCTILEFADKDGILLRARIYEASPADPHVLYFPAEYETDETLHMLGSGFQAIGFSLLALEYRGVGKSQGEFSFEKLFDDAELFFDAVKTWMSQNDRQGHVAVMGRSLGCVPALDVALKRQKDVLCLIMESGFDSAKVFLERSGIDSSLIPDVDFFENRQKMASFKKPVLFIHSPRDVIQSLTEVEWLVAESRSKATQFQIAPSGTRQELATQVGELYLEVVQQWVNLRRGVRPPRKRRPIFS